MVRALDPADLALIVRGLHQDVSSLDDRLRKLEAEIRSLRDREATDSERLDLRVLGSPPGA